MSGSVTTGQDGFASSSMENTTVVPNSPVHTDRLPQTHHPRGGDNDQPDSSPNVTSISRMAYLRKRYRDQKLSDEATDLMLSSWRSNTNKSYDSLFSKWSSWCTSRGSDPISGPITEVLNFLANLYKEGYQYSSINSYRSAISSVHEKIDGYNTGQHPLVTRLIKGVFHVKPPLPRYTHTWSVQMILGYLRSLGDNKDLSLKHLSWKVAMLLALTRSSRSADLSQLDLSRRVYKPDRVCFQPSSLAKQSRQRAKIANFFFPSFPNDSLLCPVAAIKAYEERTALFWGKETRLLLAIIKPHRAVLSCSVARWLKSLLKASGIDTSIFNAHSV